MIESTAKDAWVFWQTNEEDGVGEPAILIEKYSDTICLTSDNDNRIKLNYDSLDEFVRLLKRIKKLKDEE